MISLRRVGSIGYWGLVFGIPLGMFLWAMWTTGIHPFGEQSILSEDLRIQYIDFYSWYQGVLFGDNNLFYSFTPSLGTNMWGLFAYYLSSPFNLLVIFFDETSLTDFIALITMLKLACVNVSMVFYLRKRFHLNHGLALALGICFTYSMWSIIQTRNILWIDALIILPLIAYGLYCFVRKGSWRLLVASLTIAIITCWYTAYMLILFSFLFFSLEMYLCHVEERELTRKQVFKKIVRFVGFLMLALGLSMIVFLPAIMAMLSSGGTSIGEGFSWKSAAAFAVLIPVGIVIATLFGSRRISLTMKCLVFVLVIVIVIILSFIFDFVGHSSFIELLSSFFYGNQRGGVTPQFFSGTMVALLLMLFFFTRAIPQRVKLAMAIFLFIMVMSAWNNHLYFIWCGFKAPFGFYSRIAFLFVFLSIFAAAFVLRKIQDDEVKLSELMYASISIVGVVIVLFFVGGLVYPINLLITLTSAFVCVVLLSFYILRKDSRFIRSAVCSVLVVVVVVEQGSLLQKEWKQFYLGYTQDYHDAYIEESRTQLDELKSSDDSWFRVEKTHIREWPATLNEGLSGGFMQLSSYASTSNYSAIGFLNSLGYSKEGEFSTRYAEPILLSDSLLGVKYVSTGQMPQGFTDIELLKTTSGDSFFENPYALGLGYEVDAAALELDFDIYLNPFERQNALISAFVGSDTKCYVPIEAELIHDEANEKSWSIKAKEGTSLSFYVESSEDVPVWVSVDQEMTYKENWRFQHAIHEIGQESDAENTHTITLTPEIGINDKTGLEIEQVVYAKPLFYSFDLAVFEDAIRSLKEHSLSLEVIEDGYVRGTYVSDTETQLMMSIPNAPGWTLKVNGENIEPLGICDNALMIIPIEKGTSEIELSYQSPGVIPGVIISVLSLLFAIGLYFASTRPQTVSEEHDPDRKTGTRL